jgi:hypothetical protein
MYAMVCTRLDIAHAVGFVNRYINNLGEEHWEAVKWILKYLRGTTTHALCFGGPCTFLQGYVDPYMAGDKDNRRRTTRYVFTIGGTTVSWDFETIKGCCTFNNRGRVCCYYRG